MYQIDLKGKVAFIAGVGDNQGFAWAIAKELANAGATIIIGVWPPIHKIFSSSLSLGKYDETRELEGGKMLEFAKIYSLDAAFDHPEEVPNEIKNNKRYACHTGYTISEVAAQVEKDFGKIDILVHAIANGPEVKKPLIETSRSGYLAALSASAYSYISLVSAFGPIMNSGGACLTLTYLAASRVVPGYGGGMSSAKAALESDTKTLAFEAGRKYGIRVNAISAGVLASRAAKAIGFIEKMIDHSKQTAPLSDESLSAQDVGHTACFILSPKAKAITGTVLFVDHGYHVMGAPAVA